MAGYSQPKEQRDIYAGYQQQMTTTSTGLTPSSAGGPSPFLGSLHTPPPPGTGAVLGGYRHQHPYFQQQSPYSSSSSTATGISAAYYFRRAGSVDPSVGTCCGVGTATTRSTCSGVSGSTAVLTTFGTGSGGTTTGSGLIRQHTVDSTTTANAMCEINDSSAVVCCGGRTATTTGDGNISGSGDTTSSAYVEDVVGLQTFVAPPFGQASSSRPQFATTCIGGNNANVLPPKTYVFSGHAVA